ncbi:MAG: hypothetical protein M1570_02735 [Chloroflexi bacterium]|nr:hypothetical protein [Chloroflexota bacterium]
MANRLAEFVGFLIAWAVTFGAIGGFCLLAAWLQALEIVSRIGRVTRGGNHTRSRRGSQVMNTSEIDDKIREFDYPQSVPRVLAPAEFAEKMERLSRESDRDWEPGQRHVAADELMYTLLTELGYGEGVAISREMNVQDGRQER